MPDGAVWWLGSDGYFRRHVNGDEGEPKLPKEGVSRCRIAATGGKPRPFTCRADLQAVVREMFVGSEAEALIDYYSDPVKLTSYAGVFPPAARGGSGLQEHMF